jgi:hypothetical protein
VKYLPPARRSRAPSGSLFSQPDQIAMMLRCTACRRKVAYVTSRGDLEWWTSDHHEGCGVFDFDSVKGEAAPLLRKYDRTGEQQRAVDITPRSA